MTRVLLLRGDGTREVVTIGNWVEEHRWFVWARPIRIHNPFSHKDALDPIVDYEEYVVLELSPNWEEALRWKFDADKVARLRRPQSGGRWKVARLQEAEEMARLREPKWPGFEKDRA